MAPHRDPVEVEIHGIGSGGAGVGRLPGGKVVFVHRTVPGDRARVRVTEEHKSWARGRLLEILVRGPGRRAPSCPFYDRCGGCTLEHLEYPDQLRAKGRMVADALQRIAGIRVDPPKVKPSPREFRYRSRVTFTLRRERGGVKAGFHALEAPGTIVNIGRECLLPVELLAEAWDRLRSAWGERASRLPAGDELRLTLRAVGEGVVLVIHGGDGPGEPRELLRRVERLRAVWKVEKGGQEAVLLAGLGELREEWLGEEVSVPGLTFLQVNRPAAAQVHRCVLDRAGAVRGRRVVDGYCGVGLYGRALARKGARVVGIDAAPGAVASAREGAPEGFQVLEGRVEALLPEALPADLVLLNPPRRGLAASVPPLLAGSSVPRVIYVSCHEGTLARDLDRLSKAYALKDLRSYDLFPQTAHVETVVVLDRRQGPSRNASGEPG